MNFAKKSDNAEKTVKPNLQSCLVTGKALNNYGTQKWHPLEAPEIAF